MSKFLSNVSIQGQNSFRKLSGPATASISSLTYSTSYNRKVLITVNNPIILREVSIYTQVGDYNHIDTNNRFVLISSTNSVISNSYVGWQASWNATASMNYYSMSNYTFSTLLNTTPILQRLPIDMYLNVGSYDFYLDESIYTSNNLGYIMCSTGSTNYPFTDSNSNITINSTSSIHIYYNWIVSDVDDLTIEKGGLGIYNNLTLTQSSFSMFSGNNEFISIKHKDYSTYSTYQPSSVTASFVISPINSTTSYLLKIGNKTNYDSHYDNPTGAVYMANSNNIGSWVSYSNYANAVSRVFDFWTSGTLSSSRIGYVYSPITGWTTSSTSSLSQISYLPPITSNLLVCYMGIDAVPNLVINYYEHTSWRGRTGSSLGAYNTSFSGRVNFTGVNGQQAIYYGSSAIQGLGYSSLGDIDHNYPNFQDTQKMTVFLLFSISGINSSNYSGVDYVLTTLDPNSNASGSVYSFKVSYDTNYKLIIKINGNVGENVIKTNSSLILNHSYLASIKLDKTDTANNQIKCNLTNLTVGNTYSFNIISSYLNTNTFRNYSTVGITGPFIGSNSDADTCDANIGAVLYYNTLLSDANISNIEKWIKFQYSYTIDIGNINNNYILGVVGPNGQRVSVQSSVYNGFTKNYLMIYGSATVSGYKIITI